jgi:iron complex outermembrane receptor protein
MKNKVACRTRISAAVALALGAGFVPYALAQQAGDVQRIEVTGSRLPSLSLEGPSPVTVLNAQDIKFDGAGKTEDLLRQLPMAADAQQAYLANGATGTAQVNLRGLGSTRNLVLVNGRRLPPGSPLQGGYSADLNEIPAGLVQRVEILTGSASAVYGSDAVSGVVNFIMRDNFEGLQVNLNHSFYNHSQGSFVSGVVAGRAAGGNPQYVVPGDVTSDGDVFNASVLMGGNFASGRGNATVYFDWKKEDPILEATRDFSACAVDPDGAGGWICNGSSTSFPGRFFLNQGTFTVADAAGNVRPFTTNDQFNYAPYNYFRRPDERYSFGAFAHYDLFSNLRVYTELGFHTDRTLAQIAPSGMFGLPVNVQSNNPLLTPGWIGALTASNAANTDANGNPAPLPFDANNPAAITILRRNIEGGGRVDDLRHESFRFVFGFKGEAFKYWNYDVSMQTGRVTLSENYLNEFSRVKAARAMDAVTDANGNVVCRSVVDGSDPNCVPYNLWSLGAITPAALRYIQSSGFEEGYTQQQILTTNWTVDLGNYGIKLPTARNGVGLSLGSERRQEEMQLRTDQEYATGDLFGQGGPTIGRAGKTQVGEYFGELRVPLIEKHPMADLLSVSASYRHSKYTRPTEKTANTYGAGIEWAPVHAYKLRASYQKAIRAPNLEDLFLAQGTNLFGLNNDPCGPNPTATLAQCQRSGITPGQYGAAILQNVAGQYNYLQGGNTALDPEKAKSKTFGLVFQPTRNLSGSIDYWDIKIEDYISAPPPSTVLNQCIFNNVGCANVQRDQFGTLWLLPSGFVTALNSNLGGIRTKGWDFAASYNHSLGRYGNFGLHYLGSLMTKWVFEPIKGLGEFDCAGYFGFNCLGVYPKYRHKLRASWTTPWNVELALTWRHIDKVKNEATSGDPQLADPTVDPLIAEMAKRDYLDIAGSWRINKTFSLSGGINNITDKDPPIVGGTQADPTIGGNGNTFPGVYDVLGRLVFINLQANF